MPITMITIKTMPRVSFLAITLVKLIYESVDLSKALLKRPKNFPSGPRMGLGFLKRREHRAGLRVKALRDEKSTDIVTVMANC